MTVTEVNRKVQARFC